jgi:hypothetical protein
MGLVGGPSARSTDTKTDNKKETFNFEYNSDQQVFYLYNSTYGYISVTIDPPGSEYYKYWQVAPSEYDSDGHYGTLDEPFFETTNETASVVIEDYTFDTDHGYYQVNLADMVIYVYESSPSLTTVNVPSSSGTSETLLPREDRTTYDTYEESTEAVDEVSGNFGTYYSDTGTSDIETLLGRADKDAALDSDLSAAELKEKYAEITAEQKENDGRIVTDKTVTYNDDPYDVYDIYADDEFSVTLSALGQEWTISEETTTPIDVIFLLDFSSSMTAAADSSGEVTRWMAEVDAVNDAMEEILERNSNNRVGVVLFSSTAKTLLPLGRYEVVASEETAGYTEGYLSYLDKSLLSDDDIAYVDSYYKEYYKTNYNEEDHTLTLSDWDDVLRPTLATNSGLYYQVSDDGTMEKFSQINCYQSFSWSATYTQLGLQQAYKEFATATPTVTVGEENVTRQPVFIFLTDGEPTYGTYNYMDPASGPRYGYGNYGEAGMFGYYTILSANYFKNMVSAHYGKTAAFYSVGIGMKASGSGSALLENTGTTNYYADDTYRRAVINPTKSNVTALNDDVSATYAEYYSTYGYTFYKNMTICDWKASKMLYNLLTSSDPTSYVQNTDVRYFQYSNGYMSGYNTDEYWLRAIKNPYASDYSYADDAMFYETFTEKDLEEFFDKIIGTVQKVNYGILLKKGTDLVITDPLGEGMEVVGDPTLIYNGVAYKIDPLNDLATSYVTTYGSYTEYTWTVTTPTRAGADKKGTQTGKITARIHHYTKTGMEVVQFIIPENLLPALYPDAYQEFYYEELPVRLVYKVGLTDEAARAAEAGDVFYTNLYEEGDDPTTKATFYPDSTNPYYVLYDPYDDNYVEEPWLANGNNEREKEDNTTDTADDAFWEDVNYEEDPTKNEEDWDVIVTQYLGNNGKIIMSTTSATNPLTVDKQWASGTDSEPISVTLYASGTRQKNGETTTTKGVWEIDTETITSADNWTYTWTDLPESETKDGYIYTYTNYYILESSEGTYNVSYQDSNGNTLTPKTITVTEGDTSQEVSAVQVDGSKITIINKPTYALPNSGGVGTQVYTWSGMATLTIAIALYALIRRRQRNRGRGGEVS